MQKQRFYEAADALFKRIRDTQDGNIEAAAELMAESIAHGGCIHLFDTGHIIDAEMVNRAGGMVLLRRFRYNLNVENTASKRDRSEISTSQEGLANIALRCSQVKSGDVMVIGSVSGKTMNVVDLAFECKKMGVKVIGVTSIEYSSTLVTDHSSGKRLFELADVTINNCAPYGDAMMDVEGLEVKYSPASGIGAAYLMWACCNDLLEKLLARGITPSVLKSVNYPPNIEYNKTLYKRYEEEGI